MKINRIAWLTVTWMAFAASVQATSLVQMSLQQLTQASTVIVRAHVLDQYSAWDAAHKKIQTFTVLAVDHSVKGNSPATLTVQQVGGVVGNIHLFVPGSVRFLPQSQYMLFLEPAVGTPNYLLVGMVQGAYRIYHDSTTGKDRVISPMGNFFFGSSHTKVQAQPQTVPLTSFQRDLSSAIAEPIRIPAGTSIPVAVRYSTYNGVERLHVAARTQFDLFPSTRVVIPAGSEVQGIARKVRGQWMIHWQSVSVAGQSVPILSVEQPAGAGPLQGQTLVIQVR